MTQERRVIRHCSGCGRPVLEGETPQEWAAAEIAHHGPPPKELEDRIRSIVHRHAGIGGKAT